MRALLAILVVAYVMPSYSILKRVAERRDNLTTTSIKMEGLASVAPVLARDVAGSLGTFWSSGELQLNATVWMRMPGRCRLELSSLDSTRSIAAVWNNGKRRSEGGELRAAQIALEEACALLSVHSGTEGESRGLIENHLHALKIETKQTSLGRFAGTVAFVIGDRAEGSPQLWVYKEHFHPARLRFTDDKGAWDVRFIDYAAQATGDWWPRLIEVYKGEELQLKISILSAEGKANLEAVKF